MTKILMIVPDTTWPAVSGGKRAHDANIKELLLVDPVLNIVMADVYTTEAGTEGLHDRYHGATITFAKSQKLSSQSRFRRFFARLRLFLSPFPPTYEMLRHIKGYRVTEKSLKQRKTDLIWVDHLNAMSLVPKRSSLPTVLLMHNVEADLLRDIWIATPRLSLRWIKRWIDWHKMKWVENSLVKKADAVVCLSSRDADILEARLSISRPKVLLPLPFALKQQWRSSGEQRLLFVGQATHTPNLDAIQWLVRDLAPSLWKIAPSISIDIVGSQGAEFVREAVSPSVHFRGKVSASELDFFLSECSAMISPVVIGSGIKIKVLEAASRGVPVIATPESLYGLEILTGCVVFDRHNVEQSAQAIAEALTNPALLEEGAQRNFAALQREFEERGSRINEIVRHLLKEVTA